MQLSKYCVSIQTVEVLYVQGLMWMTIPFFPFLAWLMPILFYCNFKFEKLVLSYFTSKNNDVFGAEEVGSFFMIFYTLTIVGLSVGCNLIFLIGSWNCDQLGGNSVDSSGPFSRIDQPLQTIRAELEVHDLELIYDFLLSPAPWVIFWGMSQLKANFSFHKIDSLKERLKSDYNLFKDSEDQFKKECTTLTRKLEFANKIIQQYEEAADI